MIKQPFSMLALAIAMLMPAAVMAEGHQTAEPWTVGGLRTNLAAMPAGDVARGEKLNQDMMCASCHGDAGQALTRNWPSTAGQRAVYTYKTLQDYAAGRFAKHAGADAMAALSGMLSQQDMADLAVFYATKSLPTASERPSLDAKAWQVADQLARQGDAKRLITPCASCHGVKGEGGINETPALAGQEAYYFERTMQAYQQGTRATDVHAAMRQFATSLSDAEIQALAAYYAGFSSTK
jgi:cytochrome c553